MFESDEKLQKTLEELRSVAYYQSPEYGANLLSEKLLDNFKKAVDQVHQRVNEQGWFRCSLCNRCFDSLEARVMNVSPPSNLTLDGQMYMDGQVVIELTAVCKNCYME